MKSYFIVGTDTDCGKTYVTCELVRYLQKKAQNVLAIKPIASGCILEGGQLVCDDIVRLDACNGVGMPVIDSWRLTAPISPHLAAIADSVRISVQDVVDFCRDERFLEFDRLLIEGAGGLMVPLNEQETWVDFLIESQIPVILVVGLRLGCINHALLTAFALKQHAITCVGWIANGIDKDMLSQSDVIETLVIKLDWPLLATIPYKGHIEALSLYCV